MKFIRISVNESKALLTRVCESHYKHQYDYEDIAAIVQWLELHDLDGIRTLLDEINKPLQKNNTLTKHKKESKQRLILELDVAYSLFCVLLMYYFFVVVCLFHLKVF